MRPDKLYAAHQELLSHIHANLGELAALLREVDDHWGAEDGLYRFYHHSYKVFYLQQYTERIVLLLQALRPGEPLCELFAQIVADGTGKTFSLSDNARWRPATAPIVEAFLHARYFLQMAVRYGEQLESPPESLPSGWAALLTLYSLR